MSINLFGSVRRNAAVAVSLVFACALGFCGLATDASAAGSDSKNNYAMLIVGDESKPEMLRSEKALISEITKLLGEKDAKGAYKYSKIRSGMQVFSYHINHEREKQFCEKKLGIYGEDLMFLGIVTWDQNGRTPGKVVYRIDRIANENRAASNVFAYASDLLANGAPAVQQTSQPAVKSTSQQTAAKTSAPASASAPAKTTAAPAKTSAPQTDSGSRQTSSVKPAVDAPPVVSAPSSASTSSAVKKYAALPEGKVLSCQLGAFSNEANASELVNDLKNRGYDASYRRFERSSGSPFYRVYSGSFTQRADAEAALQRLKESGFDKAILVTLDK